MKISSWNRYLQNISKKTRQSSVDTFHNFMKTGNIPNQQIVKKKGTWEYTCNSFYNISKTKGRELCRKHIPTLLDIIKWKTTWVSLNSLYTRTCRRTKKLHQTFVSNVVSQNRRINKYHQITNEREMNKNLNKHKLRNIIPISCFTTLISHQVTDFNNFWVKNMERSFTYTAYLSYFLSHTRKKHFKQIQRHRIEDTITKNSWNVKHQLKAQLLYKTAWPQSSKVINSHKVKVKG